MPVHIPFLNLQGIKICHTETATGLIHETDFLMSRMGQLNELLKDLGSAPPLRGSLHETFLFTHEDHAKSNVSLVSL
jgi:hypothetical protein